MRIIGQYNCGLLVLFYVHMAGTKDGATGPRKVRTNATRRSLKVSLNEYMTLNERGQYATDALFVFGKLR